jgi:hypothetical protein
MSAVAWIAAGVVAWVLVCWALALFCSTNTLSEAHDRRDELDEHARREEWARE